MSGTAQTTAQLMTTWADSGLSGRHSPSVMRNTILSGPQWDAVSGVAAPYILRGTVDLPTYFVAHGGVLGAGQVLATRQVNATALQATFDFAAANNKYLDSGPCIVEIDNTAGIIVGTTANYGGFRFFGAKDPSFLISQWHTGAPVATIGDITSANANMQGMVIDGLSLSYQGAVSTGNVLQLGHLYQSTISNLQVYGNFAVSWLVYVGSLAGTSNFFSNVVSNLNGLSANAGFIFWNGTATGNAWVNCYFQNLGGGGPTPQALSSAALSYNNPAGNAAPDDSVFDQLNMEHFACNNPMFFNQGGSTFVSPHFENVVLTGFNPAFWNLANPRSAVTLIGGNTCSVQLNSTNMTGTANWVTYFDDAIFASYGHKFIANTGGQLQTVNMPMNVFQQNAGMTPAVMRADFKLDAFRIDDAYQGHISLDSVLARATYGDISYVDGYHGAGAFPRISGRAVVRDPPTNLVIYGALGPDVIIRYTAVLGASVTIVLSHFMTSTGAGSATQRPLGDRVLIIRDSAATGAFTITVKDATTGGTTIGTFITTSAGTAQTFSYSAPVGVSYAPVWATA